MIPWRLSVPWMALNRWAWSRQYVSFLRLIRSCLVFFLPGWLIDTKEKILLKLRKGRHRPWQIKRPIGDKFRQQCAIFNNIASVSRLNNVNCWTEESGQFKRWFCYWTNAVTIFRPNIQMADDRLWLRGIRFGQVTNFKGTEPAYANVGFYCSYNLFR